MSDYTTAIFGPKAILGRRSGLMNEWRDRWAPPTRTHMPARTRSDRMNAHHAFAHLPG